MADSGGVLRPLTVVAMVVGALALAAAVVLTVSLGDGGGNDDATGDDAGSGSTSSTAPTTTTTVVIERQVSLVGDDERGTLFEVAGVAVSADDLRAISSDDSVPAEYPVVIDPVFTAAQEDADLSLERLGQQVRYLANRLGPAIEEAELTPPLVVVARPRLNDGALDAAVLVVNTSSFPRRLAFFDLRILGADSTPVTERIRFLDEAGGIDLPANAAYFNLVAFSAPQVVAPDADLTPHSWEADVRWSETDSPPEPEADAAAGGRSGPG